MLHDGTSVNEKMVSKSSAAIGPHLAALGTLLVRIERHHLVPFEVQKDSVLSVLKRWLVPSLLRPIAMPAT